LNKVTQDLLRYTAQNLEMTGYMHSKQTCCISGIWWKAELIVFGVQAYDERQPDTLS